MHLILGGARSGKSARAVELANPYEEVIFLATGVATDQEMKERIAKHKQDRPTGWKTIEEPVQVVPVLQELRKKRFTGAVLFDCLGFWIGNLMEQNSSAEFAAVEERVLGKVSNALEAISTGEYSLIMVSNIAGMGLVPSTRIGREFRDILGRANQICASEAETVTLMVAGLPVPLK